MGNRRGVIIKAESNMESRPTKHAGINGNPHTVKQAGRRVKTPETATAKKTALKSSQPAKSAAKQAVKATKKGTAKLVKAVEKAAVSAVKSIGALLGGSAGLVAVLLVVIVLAAGLLLSPLGIFFSSDAGGEVTLQQVMSELNTAFSDRITEIEKANAHDDIRQDGQRPLWKDTGVWDTSRMSIYLRYSTALSPAIRPLAKAQERSLMI